MAENKMRSQEPTNVHQVGPNHFHDVYNGSEVFKHRIRVFDKTSEWVGYCQPAVVKYKGATYVGVTDYAAGSEEYPKPAYTVMYKIDTVSEINQ